MNAAVVAQDPRFATRVERPVPHIVATVDVLEVIDLDGSDLLELDESEILELDGADLVELVDVGASTAELDPAGATVVTHIPTMPSLHVLPVPERVEPQASRPFDLDRWLVRMPNDPDPSRCFAELAKHHDNLAVRNRCLVRLCALRDLDGPDAAPVIAAAGIIRLVEGRQRMRDLVEAGLVELCASPRCPSAGLYLAVSVLTALDARIVFDLRGAIAAYRELTIHLRRSDRPEREARILARSLAMRTRFWSTEQAISTRR